MYIFYKCAIKNEWRRWRFFYDFIQMKWLKVDNFWTINIVPVLQTQNCKESFFF